MNIAREEAENRVLHDVPGLIIIPRSDYDWMHGACSRVHFIDHLRLNHVIFYPRKLVFSEISSLWNAGRGAPRAAHG